jgi:hypothetical protein
MLLSPKSQLIPNKIWKLFLQKFVIEFQKSEKAFKNSFNNLQILKEKQRAKDKSRAALTIVYFSSQLTNRPNKPECYVTVGWKCLLETNALAYWTLL